MERLTTTFGGKCFPHGAEGKAVESLTGNYCRGKFEATALVERLCEIEDILFDENGKERISLDRLKELIQADAMGRMIVSPCKVGDTYYHIVTSIWSKEQERCAGCKYFHEGSYIFRDDPCCLYNEEFDREPTHCLVIDECKLHSLNYMLQFVEDGEIGKTVFLTREEAETVLKKIRGDENA